MRGILAIEIHPPWIGVQRFIQAMKRRRNEDHVAVLQVYAVVFEVLRRHPTFGHDTEPPEQFLDACYLAFWLVKQLSDLVWIPGEIKHHVAQEVHNRVQAREQEKRNEAK